MLSTKLIADTVPVVMSMMGAWAPGLVLTGIRLYERCPSPDRTTLSISSRRFWYIRISRRERERAGISRRLRWKAESAAIMRCAAEEERVDFEGGGVAAAVETGMGCA